MLKTQVVNNADTDTQLSFLSESIMQTFWGNTTTDYLF